MFPPKKLEGAFLNEKDETNQHGVSNIGLFALSIVLCLFALGHNRRLFTIGLLCPCILFRNLDFECLGERGVLSMKIRRKFNLGRIGHKYESVEIEVEGESTRLDQLIMDIHLAWKAYCKAIVDGVVD